MKTLSKIPALATCLLLSTSASALAGPVSLICSNSADGTDASFQVEISPEELRFSPYESSFSVRAIGHRGAYSFKNVRVNYFSEGESTGATVSGYVRVNKGRTADVSYSVDLDNDQSFSVVQKGLRCRPNL